MTREKRRAPVGLAAHRFFGVRFRSSQKGFELRRRRITKPSPVNPMSIIAQVEGSGTGGSAIEWPPQNEKRSKTTASRGNYWNAPSALVIKIQRSRPKSLTAQWARCHPIPWRSIQVLDRRKMTIRIKKPVATRDVSEVKTPAT